MSLERTHALDLSNALDDERDKTTDKLVAKELREALNGVQVSSEWLTVFFLLSQLDFEFSIALKKGIPCHS